MTIKKRIATFILLLALMFTIGGEFFSAFCIKASAAVISSSDVIVDLQQDKTFNKSNYPSISLNDYSFRNEDSNPDNDVNLLSVIQIAEGEDRQLYIYTYQPLNNVSDINASSVSMYLGEEVVTPQKYTLKCVSQNGVFKKYLVQNFVVSEETYRFYNIVEIERPFDDTFDKKTSDNTITNDKAHDVAQMWCCYYLNNKLVYEMSTLDVVKITPVLTDYLFFKDGVTWGSLVGIDSGCNAHYIAFNVDNYDVDHIYDASLEYYTRPFLTTHVQQTGVLPSIAGLFGKNTEYTTTSYPSGTDYEEVPMELSEYDTVTYKGQGLWSKKFSWNRIMKSEDFVSICEDQGMKFSSSEKEDILNSQYVFAFAETSVSYQSFNTSNPDSNIDWNSSTTTNIRGTEVREVDILRLHFLSNGRTYNLGVVGDTTTGDGVPGGVAEGIDYSSMWEDLFGILSLILICIAFVALSGPISVVFNILWGCIKFLFSLIWGIIKIPFKLFGLLFKEK